MGGALAGSPIRFAAAAGLGVVFDRFEEDPQHRPDNSKMSPITLGVGQAVFLASLR